ncbi:MAG TPA: amylo-alpha-1,6-glucosidase [Bacteroidales bacterium]|nr:amylo-alpha-1,6-glucosidase [Bacteroidales bacterium]HPS17327.1 amylo-alpha-1,6-glucosidase [Bacteroidales bacterium]
MSYLTFDKSQLVNLEYILSKELLRSNRAGSYACTTIIGCNTRKYHGLLVTPQPALDGENHVLLSTLDISVVQRDAEFNFGIHKYPGGVYSPKGNKYFSDFTTEPIPKLTFRVGGVILSMELLLAIDDERLLIKYTLEDAHSPTILRFKPFLAFRNVHKLAHANVFVDRKYEKIENGIKYRMYSGYTNLFMQFSKTVEYTHAPDWNYNIEYSEEQNRGYDYQEDLFVPGFFELPIKKGESVVFSAGTSDINPALLKKLFTSETKRRIPRDSFYNNLVNSAHQFVVRRDKKTKIKAGFPWFGAWGRDTFISLPGLTLAIDDPKTCKAVLDTALTELHGPLFPNVGEGHNAAFNSADAPLWFFWALQQYAEYTNTKEQIWKEYGRKMQMILKGFKDGTLYNIKMLDNGLIYAGEQGSAVTWMDAIVGGKPVTPRIGQAVELSALWYNAIMFSLEVACMAEDESFIEEWKGIAGIIPESFKNTFWCKDRGYLADYVNGDFADWTVRPNMVFATSLPYVPLSEKIRQLILEKIQQDLLTPRGLRTLTPKHPDYKGIYAGNQVERDMAYHQGTVWPWLLGHFAEGYLKVHGKSGLPFIKSLYDGFDSAMKEHCIGTISEVYDGDPPHKAGGAISQAWSVAEILRMWKLIEKYEK